MTLQDNPWSGLFVEIKMYTKKFDHYGIGEIIEIFKKRYKVIRIKRNQKIVVLRLEGFPK